MVWVVSRSAMARGCASSFAEWRLQLEATMNLKFGPRSDESSDFWFAGETGIEVRVPDKVPLRKRFIFLDVFIYFRIKSI